MRTIQILITATATATAALAAGCGTLEEERVEQVQGPGGGDDDDCDTMTCTNSPELAYGGYHELSLRGRPNQQQIRIQSANGYAQIFQGGQAYDMGVANGRIRGETAAGAVIEGPTLVGATIVLETVPDSGPPQGLYAIRIDKVRTDVALPFQQPGTFEAYTFSFHEVGGAPMMEQHLCNAMMLFPPAGEREEVLLGMEPYETLVFEKDRIDPERKWMNPAPDPTWFNLACAGGTLAKLHLSGHTCAAQGAACPTPAAHARRQSLLKLLTADYCGTGKSFTVDRMPLLWRAGVISRYAVPPVGLEARWDHLGATCISMPRLEVHPQGSPPPPPERIWSDIALECNRHGRATPPPCTNTDVDDFDGALALSANRDRHAE